jgi:hypothetical protein
VSITNMKARLRLFPSVGSDGKVALGTITTEFLGNIDASPADHSHDQEIRDAFATQFSNALNTPDLHSALASGLQTFIEKKAGKAIPKMDSLQVDSTGLLVTFPR